MGRLSKHEPALHRQRLLGAAWSILSWKIRETLSSRYLLAECLCLALAAAVPHNIGSRGRLLMLLTMSRAAPGSQALGPLASFQEDFSSPQILASESV